jgi:formate hydrogenlyase transcriptional activator
MSSGPERRPSSELPREYAALLGLIEAIAAHRSLDDLFASLAKALDSCLPFDCLAISLHDPDANAMRLALLEPKTFPQPPKMSAPVAEGPAGWVWQSQRTRVIRPGVDPETAPVLDFAREMGLRVTCWLPMTTARRRFGVLVLGSRVVDSYPDDSIVFMEHVATQVAIAVEHALHFNEVDRYRQKLAESLVGLTERVKELTAIHQTARYLQRDNTTIEEVLQFIASLMPPAFQYPDITSARVSYGALAAAAGAFRESPWVLSQSFTTSDGTRGSIDVAYHEPRPAEAEGPFLREERDLLQSLADMLESTLDRRLAERARRHSEERLKLLLDVNNLIVSELDYTALVRRISDALRPVVPHECAAVALHDAERQQMRIEAWIAADGSAVVQQSASVPLDRSPAGIAFQRGVPMVFREAEFAAFGEHGAPIARTADIKALCCVPLGGRGGPVGVLGVGSTRADAFSPADVELLGHMSGQIALAIENALVYREMTGFRDKLAEEKHYLEEEFRLAQNFSDIVGKSSALRRTLRAIETVAPTDSTVLLLGETGTGKELLARALHDLSRRRARSFVRLHGAALPSNLIESELFGYVRGAFTGATSDRMGRLELAHEGSLFLDEVGDIPADLQVKLLRVLQEREFERLGSNRTQRVDIRLIAATNRDLPTLVMGGTFRSDLYYRLNVFPVLVPPLRDRREDVPGLVDHFVRRFSKRMNRVITHVPDATMDALMAWEWPGNIRELENVIERAVILSVGGTLHLPSGLFVPMASPQPAADVGTPVGLSAVERDAILSALRASAGVVAGPNGAAARLGLKRTTLQAKMRRLGITRPSY